MSSPQFILVLFDISSGFETGKLLTGLASFFSVDLAMAVVSIVF